MINVSEIIHDPDFEREIIIQRASKGKFVGSKYEPTITVLTLHGIVLQSGNSKETKQTEEGDEASGSVTIYTDGTTPLYVTRARNDGLNISDIFVENYGTKYPVSYRITGVNERPTNGLYKATAERMGAL